MKQFKFENGDEVKDNVTGFKGTVTGRADYVSGCRQYSITPKVGKDGEFKSIHWFDEDRLTLTKKSKKQKVNNVGGPQMNPGKG